MAKETLYAFKRNDQEEVRISAEEYRDRMYVDLRIFYLDAEASEMKPSKKGITLAAELFPELKKGMAKAETFLKSGAVVS